MRDNDSIRVDEQYFHEWNLETVFPIFYFNFLRERVRVSVRVNSQFFF